MNVVAILLSVCSLAVSAWFCWLSLSYFASANGELIAIAAGFAAGLYGIANAVILVAAWLRPVPLLRPLSRWAALAVGLLWIAGSLDSGRISGLELYSILGLAVLLAINMTSVSRVLAAVQQVNPVGSPTATD